MWMKQQSNEISSWSMYAMLGDLVSINFQSSHLKRRNIFKEYDVREVLPHYVSECPKRSAEPPGVPCRFLKQAGCGT